MLNEVSRLMYTKLEGCLNETKINGMVEEWRPVVGYEGLYEVSDKGRVKSFDRVTTFMRGRQEVSRTRKGRILSAGLDNGRYLIVALHHNSTRQYRRVHQIVAEAFIGACPEGFEACHRNDIGTDNRPCNIYYGTHQENIDDRERNRRYICKCGGKGKPKPR